MTPAEETLLRAMEAEPEWETLAFSDSAPMSDVSANAITVGEVTAALISGSVLQPAQLARALRRVCPNCLIFFVADAEQTPAVRRQLGVAPMLGPNWKLAPADIAAIQHALASAHGRAGRQQRGRTTLQRMGERLATPAARTETRFHRQMMQGAFEGAVDIRVTAESAVAQNLTRSLALRIIRVCLHFLDLRGVSFRVRAVEDDPLVGIHRI